MPEDYKSHYNSLTNDALLEEIPADLVPEARKALAAELENRGLTAPTPNPAEQIAPSTDPGDQLVPVAKFTLADEADLARALLESAGIPCFLGNEHEGGLVLPLSEFGPMPLLVPARLLDEAREILAARVSDEDLTKEAEGQ